MKRKGKSIFWCLCAFALACTGGALALTYQKGDNNAATSSNVLQIGEIWDRDRTITKTSSSTSSTQTDGTLNWNNFRILIDSITGVPNATKADVDRCAENITTAEDIRKVSVGNKKAGQDLIVTVGGLDFEVCYLSKTKSYPRSGVVSDEAKDSDTILTLWLSSNIQDMWRDSASFILPNGQGINNETFYDETSSDYYHQYFYDNNYGDYGIYSQFESTSKNYDISHHVFTQERNDYNYASIIPGILNGGGKSFLINYDDNSFTSRDIEVEKFCIFSEFTHTDYNLTDYIVQPADVTWQEYGQNTRDLDMGYSCSNENWSLNIRDGFFGGTEYEFYHYSNGTSENYAEESHINYEFPASWIKSYLWLPSLSEVGYYWNNAEHSGMWKVNANQRATHQSESEIMDSYGDRAWLRTAFPFPTFNNTWILKGCFTTEAYPGDDSYENLGSDFHDASNKHAVRPAFHLNLTKLMEDFPDTSCGDEKLPTWWEHTASSFAGGTGTASNPYIIETAEQLAKLSLDVANGQSYSLKYFEQRGDIDLSGYRWYPIGGYKDGGAAFSGTYNGNNCKIVNMYIDTCTRKFNYIGLFGLAGALSNINLVNAKIVVNTPASLTIADSGFGDLSISQGLGLIAGYSTNKISNCDAQGTIVANQYAPQTVAGGIIGMTTRGGGIENCSFDGNIENIMAVGGIVGCYCSTQNNVDIKDNIVHGNLSGQFVGGVVGLGSTSSNFLNIQNCSVVANIDGVIIDSVYVFGMQSLLGGICAYDATSISLCTFEGNISSNVESGICGISSQAQTIEKCTVNGKLELSLKSGGLVAIFSINATSVNYCYFNGEISRKGNTLILFDDHDATGIYDSCFAIFGQEENNKVISDGDFSKWSLVDGFGMPIWTDVYDVAKNGQILSRSYFLQQGFVEFEDLGQGGDFYG